MDLPKISQILAKLQSPDQFKQVVTISHKTKMFQWNALQLFTGLEYLKQNKLPYTPKRQTSTLKILMISFCP
jgi:hypothetical protein